MENKDFIRFKHILDSVEAILFFAKGKRRISLDTDRLFLSAVLREFEIIGEAARRISKPMQRKFPDFPWKELIGMRNRLIHAYFDVDRDIIWKTIRSYLPAFQKEVQEIIKTLESN